MALLRDGRRCSGLALERFRFGTGTDRCTYAISLLRVNEDGALAPFLTVGDCEAAMDELRQLLGDLDGLSTGDHRAVFYETLDPGFTLQVEADDAGGLKIDAWVDLVRANAASRMLAARGEPQAGLRFRTTMGDIQRFWAEVQDELDRMYS